MKWGCGALNIDGCRIECIDETTSRTCNGMGESSSYNLAASKERRVNGGSPLGKWPANTITDGSDEVLALFPDSKSTGGQASLGAFRNGKIYGKGINERESRDPGFGDEGSAAQFFYSSKAGPLDRIG